MTTMDAVKSSTVSLTPMETIENGLMISFQCDPGYNTQGPSNLRCWNGEWAVSSLPECLPAPCVLPQIMHAMYQGGYRAGLTIAHGSSVMIQCESGMGNMAAVQMGRFCSTKVILWTEGMCFLKQIVHLDR